jgi:hypothetical protein
MRQLCTWKRSSGFYAIAIKEHLIMCNREDECRSREVTIREGTIFSLEQSQTEFSSLREMFRSVSDAFDSGQDQDALNQLKSDVIPRVRAFHQFCEVLLEQFANVLPTELADGLASKVLAMRDMVGSLTDETEKGNFTEVGDILRFDFSDMINECYTLFPKLADFFRESKLDALDEY